MISSTLAIAKLQLPFALPAHDPSSPLLTLLFLAPQDQPGDRDASHREPARPHRHETRRHVCTFTTPRIARRRVCAEGVRRFCSIYAMNGKTVEVDNTDAEGRLILSGFFRPSRSLSSLI